MLFKFLNEKIEVYKYRQKVKVCLLNFLENTQINALQIKNAKRYNTFLYSLYCFLRYNYTVIYQENPYSNKIK